MVLKWRSDRPWSGSKVRPLEKLQPVLDDLYSQEAQRVRLSTQEQVIILFLSMFKTSAKLLRLFLT